MSRRSACALYHRVSTNAQDEKGARRQLRAAAKQRGYMIALDVEEKASSKTERPGLAHVLDAARRGKIAAVLVWKLDRFGRSTLDLLHNLQVLRDAGATFICVTQSITMHSRQDPVSNLLYTMLAGVAEFERSLISERTKVGIANARRRGAKIGRPRNVELQPGDVAWLRGHRIVADDDHVDHAQRYPWSTVGKLLGQPVTSCRDAYARWKS